MSAVWGGALMHDGKWLQLSSCVLILSQFIDLNILLILINHPTVIGPFELLVIGRLWDVGPKSGPQLLQSFVPCRGAEG